MRLMVLLAFNAFEEVMKAFAAWRLGCEIEQLRRSSSSQLFRLVLIDKSAAALLTKAQAFADLRNNVAHRFHLRAYKPKLAAFVKANSEDNLWPATAVEQRKALVEAVFQLAFNIAEHLGDLPPRGDIPIPMLNVELMDQVHGTSGMNQADR